MKTTIMNLILSLSCFFIQAQDVNFKPGVPIKVVQSRFSISYYQDDVKLNVIKSLSNVEVSKNEILIVKKLRRKIIIKEIIGLATIPIGLIILNPSVTKNRISKAVHTSKAVELYNNSLK